MTGVAPTDRADAATGPYHHGDRIEQVVARYARITPEAVAVQQGERRLSYAELVSRADRIAGALAARGVGPGDFVPVCLPRSVELVTVLLGVLTTGAAYVAMDPGWPPDRRATVFDGTRCRLLVADNPGAGRPGVPLVKYADLTAGPDRPAPLPALDGAEPACVFYTSGSTGRPKGAVSPHRGTIRTLVGHPDIPLSPTSVFLQAAPLPWDGFSLELWAPLLNGGRCQLLEAHLPALDVEALAAAVGRGVNSLWLTSSLFNVLADEAPELFGRIRLLLVGGERVSAPHVRRVLDRFPGLRLVNGYGPAESTIFTTTHVIRPSDVADPDDDVPIGRPVPRTGIRLVDGGGRPVPVGSVGEILVSGDGLATGYLDDPAETARAFVELAGVRHYRTGDLGYLDEEGLLRYRGRADRQFKVNGVRIEPGEVESVLMAHPRIAAGAVLRLELSLGRPELAMVYSSHDGVPLTDAELRAFARRRLLPAMTPTVWRHVERLPLGPTGKVDPVALRPLAEQAAGARRGPATTDPADAADPFLTDVRRLLDVPHLAASDDVFQAGATSLDAVRLVARAMDRFGRRITVADVHRVRTVDGLRELLRGGAPVVAAVPVADEREGSAAPLSHAQTRFWMAEQTMSGAADNVVMLAYLLDGPLDAEVLDAALQDVVRRHPALRTVYEWTCRLPEQRVLDPAAARVTLERVTGPDGCADPVELARLVTADWWRRPFDLEREVSLRARLCRMAEDRHLLCLNIHHVAFDGWSEQRLLETFGAAYRNRLVGRVPDGPSGPSYADYSRWERRGLKQWAEDELPFWRRTLRRPMPPVLPAPGSTGEAARRELVARASAAEVAALTGAARRHGGPPVAALLAAVGRGLGRTFDVPDVCLGTVTAGRPHPDLDDVVGYFVNPLVVPVAGVRDEPAGALLDRVVDRTAAAMAHGRTPFDELVRVLAPPRDRHPWFQVWVVVQHAPPSGAFAPGVALRTVRVPPPTTALELMFEAFPQPDGGWDLVMLRRSDGIDDGTAGGLLATVRTAMVELAGERNPGAAPIKIESVNSD
ncbi:non-ribosomal peptide synthetase [Micromonospora sp. KC207]|uniref:non-ribosomal peptide synthetase n=1 Tax=Micromonospora sp. KC207 TaxID=2530377 RepID=UPI001404A3E3|nr:non-ribosomal peptide synthetase [Micromonospora sp. KC207]